MASRVCPVTGVVEVLLSVAEVEVLLRAASVLWVAGAPAAALLKVADVRVSAAFVVAALSVTPVEVFLLPLALTAVLSLATVVSTGFLLA